MKSVWPSVRLKFALQKIGSGKTPLGGAQAYVSTGVMLLRSQNVHFDGLHVDDVVFIDEQTDAEMVSTRVQPSDVLLNITGASLGRCTVVPEDAPRANVNQHVCILRPDPNRVLPRFLNAVMQSQPVQSQIFAGENGSSREGLTFEQIGNLAIVLPELCQQRAIADFLNRETARLDALVAEKERLLELLAEKRRALITRAVTRGLNPAAPLRDSGLPWLGQIPKHWPLLRAKYLWREASIPVRDEDEMVTCFRDGQVTLRKNRREEGFTNAVKELGYQGIRAGQLVLHSMDAFAGAIGVSDSNGKCTPEYVICDALREDAHNPYYGFLVRMMALNGFIVAMCAAVRERAPRIHFSDFGDMSIPVPPPTEQRAIVAHIAAETAKLDALRAAAERTMALLKERRAALIAAAVTGAIKVPTCASDAGLVAVV